MDLSLGYCMVYVVNVFFDVVFFEIWGVLLNGGIFIGIDKNIVFDVDVLDCIIIEKCIDVLFLIIVLFNVLLK